ncbi:helix-turn-helix domain-containing protein [Ornithinimicrobium sp. Arc0846-15]|nr:helix-turn-helix domain-containing protein [Ornithinimicrobium laminariae]
MTAKKAVAKAQASGEAQKHAARAKSVSKSETKSASRSLRSATGLATKIGNVARSDGPTTRPARKKSGDLATVLSADRVTIFRGREQVELPGGVVRALRRYATELAGGDKPRLVAVTEDKATLSSQQAADMLNVSRPFVVKLARSGQLRHTKTGNRHRFALADVLEDDARARQERDDALREKVPPDGYDENDF